MIWIYTHSIFQRFINFILCRKSLISYKCIIIFYLSHLSLLRQTLLIRKVKNIILLLSLSIIQTPINIFKWVPQSLLEISLCKIQYLLKYIWTSMISTLILQKLISNHWWYWLSIDCVKKKLYYKICVKHLMELILPRRKYNEIFIS